MIGVEDRSLEAEAQALADEWTAHDPEGRSPLDRHPANEWVSRFRAIGFFIHHHQFVILEDDTCRRTARISLECPRPESPLTLFRCASPGRERGMSWADTTEHAARYGGNIWVYHAIEPRLIRSDVSPDAVLAVFIMTTTAGTELVEYVVNPTELEIQITSPHPHEKES